MKRTGITRRSFLKGAGALVAAIPVIKGGEAVVAQEMPQETEEVVPPVVAPPASVNAEPPVGSFFHGIPREVRWGDLPAHVRREFHGAIALRGRVLAAAGDDIRLTIATGEAMVFNASQWSILGENPNDRFFTMYFSAAEMRAWDGLRRYSDEQWNDGRY